MLSVNTERILCALFAVKPKQVRTLSKRFLRRFVQGNDIRECKLEDVYGIDKLVFILLEFDQIIRPNLFKNARFYNIHFSMLPKYKDMFTLAHPILKHQETTPCLSYFIIWACQRKKLIMVVITCSSTYKKMKYR